MYDDIVPGKGIHYVTVVPAGRDLRQYMQAPDRIVVKPDLTLKSFLKGLDKKLLPLLGHTTLLLLCPCSSSLPRELHERM